MLKNLDHAIRNDLKVEDKNFYKYLIIFAFNIFFMALSMFFSSAVYFVLTISVVAMFLLRKNKKLYVLVFLMPYYNVFRLNQEQSGLMIYLNALCILLYIIEYVFDLVKKKKSLDYKMLICFMVLCLYFALPISGGINLSRLCKIYFSLALMYFAYVYRDSVTIKELTFVLIIGVLSSSLISLVKPLSHRLQSFITEFPVGTDNLIRFSALQNDPNFLALEVGLCIVLSTQLYLNDQINILYPLLLLVLICIGLNTASKAFLIVFVCYFLLLLFYIAVNNKKYSFKQKILPLIITLMISVLICIKIILAILKRFGDISFIDFSVYEFCSANGIFFNQLSFDSTLNSITTGRNEIWIAYFEAIFGSIKTSLFGYGISAPLLTLKNGDIVSSHNFYIELLYHVGIIGVLLIIVSISYMVYKNKKLFKFNFKRLLPVCVMLILLFTYNCLFTHRLSLFAIIFAYSLCANNEKQIKEDVKNEESNVSIRDSSGSNQDVSVSEGTKN